MAVVQNKLSLEDKLQRKERELKLLYKVIEAIATLDLEKVLQEIIRITSSLTKADSCLVYLLDEKKKTLVLRASKNLHPNVLGKIRMKMGEGITGWVAKNRKPVSISENAALDKRFKFFSSLPEDRYQAFLSVPILNTHGVVGVINIQHRKRHEYSDDEIILMSAVGKIVGGAVENARLVEESLSLRETLETRKILQKAKGILMKEAGLSEDEAHKRIQKKSMNSRRSLREVAEAIVMAEEMKKS